MDAAVVAQSLNFGWLIDSQIAGSAAPMSKAELAYLHNQGIRGIVRLASPETDDYVISSDEVAAAGLEDLHVPVRDFHAPTLEQIESVLRFVDAQLLNGRPVAISCGAGCGRTGTILACFLVNRGRDPEEALQEVIRQRPCSQEIVDRTPEQGQVIRLFAKRVAAETARRPY